MADGYPKKFTDEEARLADEVRGGRSVVVNVRKSGPHQHLVAWLQEAGLLVYVGRKGNRHSWPQSDFANPFTKERKIDRAMMVEHYREWLDEQPGLLRRLESGELDGRALGCWCSPERCHADVLVERTHRRGTSAQRR